MTDREQDREAHEAFENWHLLRFAYHAKRDADGYYSHAAVHDRWMGWQAATAAAAERITQLEWDRKVAISAHGEEQALAVRMQQERDKAHERIAQLARELDEALELNRRLDAGRDEALAQLTRERDEARRDERERCAKVCEAEEEMDGVPGPLRALFVAGPPGGVEWVLRNGTYQQKIDIVRAVVIVTKRNIARAIRARKEGS